MSLKNFYSYSSEILVGNGRKIKFWEDSWLNERSPRDSFPNLYVIACRTGVSVSTSWPHSDDRVGIEF